MSGTLKYFYNHKGDYCLEERWELNEDNKPETFENRCLEVNVLELNRIRQEDTIKQLINAFDYDAALSLAKRMDREKTLPYIDMLYLAKARRDLNSRDVDAYIKKAGLTLEDILPVRETNEKKPTKRDIFEYALYLDLLNKRGEYSDLMRAISPLLVVLFKLILKKYVGFDVDKYSSEKKVVKWKKKCLRIPFFLISLVRNMAENLSRVLLQQRIFRSLLRKMLMIRTLKSV